MVSKTKNDVVEIIVLLDKSGSMESLRGATIENLNKFIHDQKKEKGDANFTLVTFDTNYTVLANRVNIKEAKLLTKEDYVPIGGTALYDALGRVLSVLEHDSPRHAVVCIVTDGEENASSEFTQTVINRKITALQKKEYRFVYLGANQDSFKAASSIGININNAWNFSNNAMGMGGATSYLSSTASSYRNAENKSSVNLADSIAAQSVYKGIDTKGG